MHTVTTSHGTTVSYTREGSGPALVLVHGSFSDHETNWSRVVPALREQFEVFAVARRGRGQTDATTTHTLIDEARDVAAVIGRADGPVRLVGHSYGAHCALLAALQDPAAVAGLVLYEAPWPTLVAPDAFAALDTLAKARAWDAFAFAFFANVLHVPPVELDALRASSEWPPIVADAPASYRDLLALQAYRFDLAACSALTMPVLLQIGSESPRDLYVTDALASVLPDTRVEVLDGQAHEGMTTGPAQWVASIEGFARQIAPAVDSPR